MASSSSFSPPPPPPPPEPSLLSTSRSTILAKSWSQASIGYNQVFLPRFQPWTNDALAHLEGALHHSSSFVSSTIIKTEAGKKDAETSEISKNVIHAYVPCCGPGQELMPVVDAFQNVVREFFLNEQQQQRTTEEESTLSSSLSSSSSEKQQYPQFEIQVLGLDLSPGMVEVARQRITDDEEEKETAAKEKDTTRNIPKKISVMVGDASLTPPPPLPPSSSYHIILSCFGLQQLPDPISTLQLWIKLLCVGGVAVILYWPPKVEDENGPWSIWSEIIQKKFLQEKEQEATIKPLTTPSSGTTITTTTTTTTTTTGETDNSKNSNEDKNFDIQISKYLQWQSKTQNINLLRNSLLQHPIKWNNLQHFWYCMTHYGPWNATRIKRGNDFVDGLYEDFVNVWKKRGGEKEEEEEMVHFPVARLVVFVKIKKEGGVCRDNDDGSGSCKL